MNSKIDEITSYHSYWTGAYKKSEEVIFGHNIVSWWWPGDKEAMTYTSWDWASGQPDNKDEIEDRVAFQFGNWYDEPANNVHMIICSKKASPGLINLE